MLDFLKSKGKLNKFLIRLTLFSRIVTPWYLKGLENSITRALSGSIVRGATIMSAPCVWFTSSPIKPVHCFLAATERERERRASNQSFYLIFREKNYGHRKNKSSASFYINSLEFSLVTRDPNSPSGLSANSKVKLIFCERFRRRSMQ